jgi:Tetratricopeptide repeat
MTWPPSRSGCSAPQFQRPTPTTTRRAGPSGELLPHVLAATDVRHTLDPTGEDVAWLLHHAGTYVLTRREPAPAQPLHEQALNLRRSVLGENHPGTLESATNFAIDPYELVQYEQARQLDDDTLTRRRVLGEDYPFTLASAATSPPTSAPSVVTTKRTS